MVNLISHTTTRTGLSVEASLDFATYNRGIKVSDEEMASLRLNPTSFIETGIIIWCQDQSKKKCTVYFELLPWRWLPICLDANDTGASRARYDNKQSCHPSVGGIGRGTGDPTLAGGFSDNPSWNVPKADIDRELAIQRDLFLVGDLDGEIVGTVMAGFDGHRGWVHLVAVAPKHRQRGFGRAMMIEAEKTQRHRLHENQPPGASHESGRHRILREFGLCGGGTSQYGQRFVVRKKRT